MGRLAFLALLGFFAWAVSGHRRGGGAPAGDRRRYSGTIWTKPDFIAWGREHYSRRVAEAQHDGLSGTATLQAAVLADGENKESLIRMLVWSGMQGSILMELANGLPERGWPEAIGGGGLPA